MNLIPGKIWERYLLRECLKAFFLFLLTFYFLYVVIDYSTHLQEFIQGKIPSIWKIILYYLLQFVKRSDILLPLSLLLSSIQTLSQLNHNKELVALLAAGISKKTILRPFIFLGIFCCVTSFFLNEFVIPYSLNTIDQFYYDYLRHSYRGNRSDPFRMAHLTDHSKILYQYYDTSKDAFFDVIWIRNANDIWKMKYLKGVPEQPQGLWVDHLTRNQGGYIERDQSYSSYVFTELKWDQNIPRKGYIPFENRSTHELLHFLRMKNFFTNYEKHELLTQLLFKWTMPFCSLLVVIGIAPFCMHTKRHIKTFFLYVFGLFCFVAFVAFMDASVILGENNRISPYTAILLPFTILSALFRWRFAFLK